MDPKQRFPVNQVPPLVGHHVVNGDPALVQALGLLSQEPAAVKELDELGRLAGSVEAREHWMRANTETPVLTVVDRYGNRLDEVGFSDSWHWLMERSIGFGLGATPWVSQDPQAHLKRAAGFYAWGQVEQGHMCPTTMTNAVIPALRADDSIAGQWVDGLASTSYDFGLRPAREKRGLIAGMGMTEKQGGSDLRTNTSLATPTEVDGEYLIDGHKWFVSAPMSDVFLILAQAPGGMTCFVLPRVLPDGSKNALALIRLKDKLGNRSNASSEVEFHQALGYRLGEEGRGIRTIIDMVAATRIDTILGSASIMRKALAEAAWHAKHRRAFSRLLLDQPAMTNVLADLQLETEASMLLGLRLAQANDRAEDAHEQALKRIGTPIGKFWVTKRTPFMVAEALECLGGNGYVEESGLPLLFRESPVNSVWEGSGSINALDALRALQREPDSLDAWITEVSAAKDENRYLATAFDQVLSELSNLDGIDYRARRIAGLMATSLQAALLFQYSEDFVADAFCASRLAGDFSGTFGLLPTGVDAARLAERAVPQG